MSTIIDGTTGITFPDASTQAKAVSQVTPFAVTASAIAGAELQLPEATANGVNYVALKAPNTLAANTTFTLPAADGTSGQVLQTNASGVLAFGNVAAANGGTGLTSPGTAGNLLTSNGTGWTSAAAPAGAEIVRVARTSNTQIGAANRSNLIDITSGTFSQTFAAAATLTSGWFCYIRNSGTGDITLDPDGAETIDGLTTYIMYPGECRLVQCDGTVLRTIVLNAFYRVFTASGTFTKPPGYTGFSGALWGGGGSGVGGNLNEPAGGGGGACNIFSVSNAFLSASCTVTIGAGGLSAVNAAGNGGGTSSFDGKFSAFGGGGGASSTSGGGGGVLSAASGATGGTPGNVSSTGNSGFGGSNGVTGVGLSSYAGGASGGGCTSSTSANAGGPSFYGGGGGGSIGTFLGVGDGGNGGVSVFGGNGGKASGTAGVAGSAPGGGGGAGQTTGISSGAGGRGELRIMGIV
jgi:hypothetical protein